MGLNGLPEKRSLPNAELGAAAKLAKLIAHAGFTQAKASTTTPEPVRQERHASGIGHGIEAVPAVRSLPRSVNCLFYRTAGRVLSIIDI
jgi:hypothetical protein